MLPCCMTKSRRAAVAWLLFKVSLVVCNRVSVTATSLTAPNQSHLSNNNNNDECEILPIKLTYRQEEAPRDVSSLLPVVVEHVNKVLEGVVDVEVEWTGADLHGHVGEHSVQCRVTRLASSELSDPSNSNDTTTSTTIRTDTTIVDSQERKKGRKTSSQCFQVPFSILDTNECLLPLGHAMRHQCADSTICVNTNGSYECLCPRIVQDNRQCATEKEEDFSTVALADATQWSAWAKQMRSSWEVSFNETSRTSCPSAFSTWECCPENAHSVEGSACRARFACPVDPCSSRSSSSRGNNRRHNCARKAKCVRGDNPSAIVNFRCQCPDGLMGNGKQCTAADPIPSPKIQFDGVTPTEETIRNNYYCDCTKPIVDACAGFPPCTGKHESCAITLGNVPKCKCKPGYVLHEKYGCVDENPPLLRLKNDPMEDQALRLKQGDVYKEFAVEIQDENAEEYLRSLKITYSQPLPPGCLTKVGEFHVNYTVATPWTSPPYVTVTRRVIIEDVDECQLNVQTLQETCPELIPHCDVESGAICVNTIGSYRCQCPKHTSGDGFLPGLSFAVGNEPNGYRGGDGCRDTTKPVIRLQGPNPKIFRVCECGGLSGIIENNNNSNKNGEENDSVINSLQRQSYENEIKDLIRSSQATELCATLSNVNPIARDCVVAYDETYRGRIDLSQEVVVGEPVEKSPLHWVVPYNVRDKAGNEAETVWRAVVVEEVALGAVEAKIRDEMLRDRETDIEFAVAQALEKDRRKRKVYQNSESCPTCPKCDCSQVLESKIDASICDSPCGNQNAGSCAVVEESLVIQYWLWLETVLSPLMLQSLLVFMLCIIVFVILQFLWNILFRSPSNHRSNLYENDEHRQRVMLNSVKYYRGSDNGMTASEVSFGDRAVPPRTSMSMRSDLSNGGSLFNHGSPSLFSPAPPRNGGASENAAAEDSIYVSSPIITPNKYGDGVRIRMQRNPR